MITYQELLLLSKSFHLDDLKISSIDLNHIEDRFNAWIAQKFYGDMDFLHKHGTKRYRPAELIPETISIITVKMSYADFQSTDSYSILNDSKKSYISRYALGRDYHKTFKQHLEQFAKAIQLKINQEHYNFNYRVFVDSAPVMEVELANQSGLGWRGKHSLLISKEKGSNFFLGEIYTNLPLKPTKSINNHCGTCQKCIEICPTQAIIQPYVVDARRCISYLTIEFKGEIPLEFRKAIGNRIYGCDDCQLFCPWNRFASKTFHDDFKPRHGLDNILISDIFQWSEADFKKYCAGSAIYRIGYDQLMRNCAVALGNDTQSDKDFIKNILNKKLNTLNISDNTKNHIKWAISQINSIA